MRQGNRKEYQVLLETGVHGRSKDFGTIPKSFSIQEFGTGPEIGRSTEIGRMNRTPILISNSLICILKRVS